MQALKADWDAQRQADQGEQPEQADQGFDTVVVEDELGRSVKGLTDADVEALRAQIGLREEAGAEVVFASGSEVAGGGILGEVNRHSL